MNNNVDLVWEDFVNKEIRSKYLVGVDRSIAAKIVDAGALGGGYFWAQIFYSWVSVGLLLAAIPIMIWWKWYWGIAALILHRLLWKAVKTTAGQGVLEKCASDPEFYYKCLRAGAVVIREH